MTNALTAALLVIEGMTRLAVFAETVSNIIIKARAEGRDVSDEELEGLRSKRKAAVEAFLNT